MLIALYLALKHNKTSAFWNLSKTHFVIMSNQCHWLGNKTSFFHCKIWISVISQSPGTARTHCLIKITQCTKAYIRFWFNISLWMCISHIQLLNVSIASYYYISGSVWQSLWKSDRPCQRRCLCVESGSRKPGSNGFTLILYIHYISSLYTV